MTLVLRGLTLNEEPISQPLVGRFDERGGTVGRSDEATLTLPDAERMISRVQAQVHHDDDHYWLENLSTVTPIMHNGRVLSTGMRVVLQEGDEIRIAGYVLEAAFENDPTSASILRGRTMVPRVQTPTPRVQAPPPPAPSPRIAPPPAAPPRTPVTPSAPLKDDSLWRGFLEGAGVDVSLPQGPTPELLSSIGEMMKIAVGGLQRLVSMRAKAKNEMQAEMTMIQARDNNPLKFSPDAVLALQMLLQPPARGFMGGPEALRDAITDLQSHQVGMTAGMRSVLEAVLDRLDPTKLEAVPIERSIFDFVRPGRRKARLWNLYLQEYRGLREEAQDNFQRVFGEAFRRAYEAQVRNLDAAYEEPDPDEDDERGGKPKSPARPRR
jgi:predicted component of type VI protein secretion system